MPWMTNPNVTNVVLVSQAQFDLIYSALGWTITSAPAGGAVSLIERDVVFSDSAPVGPNVDSLWWDTTTDVLKRWDIGTLTWKPVAGSSGTVTSIDCGSSS